MTSNRCGGKVQRVVLNDVTRRKNSFQGPASDITGSNYDRPRSSCNRRSRTSYCECLHDEAIQHEWSSLKLQTILLSWDNLPEEYKEEHLSSQYSVIRTQTWKNILALSVGSMLSLMSFSPIRNLQSSIYMNNLGILSLISLSASSLVAFLFSCFMRCSPRPKRTMIFAAASCVLYGVANQYPSYATIIPSSCLVGLFQAMAATSRDTILFSYSAVYCSITKNSFEKSLKQFQIVLLVCLQTANILGNLLLALLLENQDMTVINPKIYSNNTVFISTNEQLARTKDNYQHIELYHKYNFQETSVEKYGHLLFCVLISIGLMASFVLILFLRNPDIIISKQTAITCTSSDCCRNALRYICHSPAMVFSGMQSAYIITDFLRVIGTECQHLYFIGYVMMCYGMFQLVTFSIFQNVQQYDAAGYVSNFLGYASSCGMLLAAVFGRVCFTNVQLLLTMGCIWGFSDCVWQFNTKYSSIPSATEKRPDTGKVSTIFHGVGFLGFLLLLLFTDISLRHYVMLIALGISAVGYIVTSCLSRFTFLEDSDSNEHTDV